MNPTVTATSRVDHDPISGCLVVLGCSRRKTDTPEPMPALDLYQGGCFPQIRARLGGHPALRARLRILSALHGLIPADAPLTIYDRPISGADLDSLTALVAQQFARELVAGGVPEQLLVVAEPAYLGLLGDLPARCRLRWIDDPHGWDAAAAVLDGWGWP